MNFFAKSLEARILAPVVSLTVAGICGLVLFTSYQFSALFWAEANAQNIRKSEVLAAQMASGVKWGKTASIERVAAPILAGESTVADIIVETVEGETLFTHSAADISLSDVGDVAAALAVELGEDGAAARYLEAHTVVSVRIADPKSGDAIGVATFAWSNARKSELIGDAVMIAGGFGALVVVFTALVAIFGVKYQASRPIDAISGAMSRLASGDATFEPPYEGRRDVIGAMAEAVRVFRDNAHEIEKLSVEKAQAAEEAAAARIAAAEQEAKAKAADDARRAEESEKQAQEAAAARAEQEEREARLRAAEEAQREQAETERREMMARLRSAFGAVIDAAAEGDFTQRAAVDFDDEELNELAAGLNRIVETMARGLGETCEVLDAVSRRNLSRRVRSAFEGEFASLKEGVNLTADTLSRIVLDLQNGAEALSETTATVSSGFDDLADRTTSQAASIEETSAAVDLLTRSVNQNAERAEQAREKALLARGLAEEGGEIMGDASRAMDKVVSSSNEIAAIVDMIDSIAFQTNLLSLNASVEAARAGEAGSGFAVVASEVRNLAQSAASSSADIRELIERSRGEIAGGVDFVRNASTQLSAIVSGVAEVSDLMGKISGDTNEQASKLSEINSVVTHFDEITQRNAHLVEESTAVLRETRKKVEEIQEIAGSFDLVEGRGDGAKVA